jgi:hypothetical protein
MLRFVAAFALGYYMLYTTFFQRQWKNPVVFLFPKMELSHATGRFRWCTVPLNGNFQLKYRHKMTHAGREPAI